MSDKPIIIKRPLPGASVDAHLKRYGRLPSEYAEGCPFSDKPDITCTSPECGCKDEDPDKSFCPNHPNAPKLPYLAAAMDADQRLKRREHQWLCFRCKRWVWAEFMISFDGAIMDTWAYRQKRGRKKATS